MRKIFYKIIDCFVGLLSKILFIRCLFIRERFSEKFNFKKELKKYKNLWKKMRKSQRSEYTEYSSWKAEVRQCIASNLKTEEELEYFIRHCTLKIRRYDAELKYFEFFIAVFLGITFPLIFSHLFERVNEGIKEDCDYLSYKITELSFFVTVVSMSLLVIYSLSPILREILDRPFHNSFYENIVEIAELCKKELRKNTTATGIVAGNEKLSPIHKNTAKKQS